MTLPDAQDLLGMWEEEPPAFVLMARIEAMLAAWFGVRRSAGPEPLGMPAPDDMVRMQSALVDAAQNSGGAFARADHSIDDGAVYDFEALKARHAG